MVYPNKEDTMEDKLKKALQELEYAHAVIWTQFDPSGDRGDKDQPKEIKELLKRMRQFSALNGHEFDGWQRG